MDRMRITEPRADMRAEPVFDLAGFADARGGECVAKAPELLNLQAHRIDDAMAHQRHDLADGSRRLVGLDRDRYRTGDEFEALEVVPRHRLLHQVELVLRHAVDGGDRV